MQTIRIIVAVTTLACNCALVGCSGTSPFGAKPVDAYSTTNGFDNPNSQPYDQLAQAFPQQNVIGPNGARLPAQPPASSDGGWMASLRNTGTAINDAFSIPTRTVPAGDPTSLAGDPGDVGGALNYHAAKVYEDRGNIPGAMALYQKTLHMAPSDTRAMISYARLLDRENNFREAERLYQQALALEPENAVALNDLGMIYAKQGMLDAALVPLGKAVALHPSNQRYCNNRAIVLIDAGRVEEALEQLTRVHGAATAHYNLGYLLARRELNDQAVSHLQQALSLNPQLVPAQQLLASLPGPTTYAEQATPPSVQNVSGYPATTTFAPHSVHGGPTRPLPPL